MTGIFTDIENALGIVNSSLGTLTTDLVEAAQAAQAFTGALGALEDLGTAVIGEAATLEADLTSALGAYKATPTAATSAALTTATSTALRYAAAHNEAVQGVRAQMAAKALAAK